MHWGAATVGVSWSSYLNQLLSQYGMAIPPEFSSSPSEGGIINLPAILLYVLFRYC